MMNNRISKLFLAGVMLFSITSCKKNNMVADQDIVPPTVSEIIVPRTASNNTVTYYIENTPNDYFAIPVGITTVANVDRTITFSYTSTTGATAGTHYTAPASLTIKAGQALDTLKIKGLFAAFPASSTVHDLIIKISGGDVPKNANRDSVKVILRKYCAPSLAAMAGTYPNTKEYTVNNTTGALTLSWPPAGGYTTTVTNLVSTGATTATGLIGNLYDFGWNDIQATFDWTDKANFKVTIAPQNTGVDNGGGATHVRTTTSTSTFKVNSFNACDRTITLSLDIYNPTTGAAAATNYRWILQ